MPKGVYKHKKGYKFIEKYRKSLSLSINSGKFQKGVTRTFNKICQDCGEEFTANSGCVKLCNECKQKRKEFPFKEGMVENVDYVICQLCGYMTIQLQNHIKKHHCLTGKQYKEKFPGSKLQVFTKETLDKLSKTRKGKSYIEIKNDEEKAQEWKNKQSRTRIIIHHNKTDEERKAIGKKISEAWKILVESGYVCPRKGKKYEDYLSPEKAKKAKKARERVSFATIKQIEEGRMPKAYTSIARKVVQSMKDSNLWSEDWFEEKRVGWYCIDIINFKDKIAILPDGDYWHTNPKLYPSGPVTKAQKKNIGTDNRRNSYLKNHDWNILHLWESDIKNNINMCINKIIKIINSVPAEIIYGS